MEKPNLSGKWKKPKKDQILIGILAGILLLIIVFPEKKESQISLPAASAKQDDTDEEGETDLMERKLQKILSQVEGVGAVKVMITLKSGGRKTVEKDHSVSENTAASGQEDQSTLSKTTEETTIYIRDGDGNETPFVIEETAPKIEGVLVAAQGGDNLTVAENIADAAMVLFGVEAHKIKIMKLN
ncbi:MAG: stage III sporulation protein AG [Lachnospiraceae bacterium]|nr:stage III sporulation protein AG [Lachnospiraceae bacterium]